MVLPSGAHVKYIDRKTVKALRQEYPELRAFPLVRVDIVDDGKKLEKIKSESQDFLIANHFLEHCENPIGAIESFLRVLKKGGILYMAIPDKRFTFDINRPITKLKHLLKDYTGGVASSREEHYREWAYFVDKKSALSALKKYKNKQKGDGYLVNFSVENITKLADAMDLKQSTTTNKETEKKTSPATAPLDTTGDKVSQTDVVSASTVLADAQPQAVVEILPDIRVKAITK